MIKATLILGQDAVGYYNENEKIPSEKWLRKNGGAVNILHFNSLKEYEAYAKAVNDTDGWFETSLLDKIYVPDITNDCNYCEDWRKFFASKETTTFCPDCGKIIIVEHDEEVEFHGKKYPVRILDEPGDYYNYRVSTEEFEKILLPNGSPVSDEASDIDETIFYYLPLSIMALPDSEIIRYIIDNS